MKIVIIPDVHGRTFWKKIQNNIDDFDQIIFLGDYVDPYQYEGISVADAIENLKEIIQFKKDNPTKVHLLLGNHDGQYMGWSHTQSRLSAVMKPVIKDLFMINFHLFHLAYKVNNLLFTHAGVSEKWLEQNEYTDTAETICDKLNHLLNQWYHTDLDEPYVPSRYSEFGFDSNPSFADIGRSRGGFAPSGGPTWADITDMVHGPAYDGELIQIFGHSQLRETGTMFQTKNCYMCDSREIFIWDEDKLIPYES